MWWRLSPHLLVSSLAFDDLMDKRQQCDRSYFCNSFFLMGEANHPFIHFSLFGAHGPVVINNEIVNTIIY